MNNPGVISALRVIALSDADEENPAAWYKSKCRWYSREFHTPLAEVLEMPIETVLQTWYEDLYWELKQGGEEEQQNLQQIIISTLAIDSPTFKAELDQITEEDEDWYEREIDELHTKLQRQRTVTTKKPVIPDKDGILIDKPGANPNLNEAYHINVNPIDDPVFDDDED